MGGPIYQIFVGRNNIASNIALKNMSKEELASISKKEEESRKAVGATAIVMCDSAWADEERPWWGAIRFPSLEARIQHVRTLKEIGWLDYSDAFSLLGTSEEEPQAVKIENPIYKLWLIKNNPAAAQANTLAKGLEGLVWAKHNAIYEEYKSQVVLYCSANWCNEAYLGFGISIFPDIEANMRVMETLTDLGWPRYTESITLLGISV